MELFRAVTDKFTDRNSENDKFKWSSINKRKTPNLKAEKYPGEVEFLLQFSWTPLLCSWTTPHWRNRDIYSMGAVSLERCYPFWDIRLNQNEWKLKATKSQLLSNWFNIESKIKTQTNINKPIWLSSHWYKQLCQPWGSGETTKCNVGQVYDRCESKKTTHQARFNSQLN